MTDTIVYSDYCNGCCTLTYLNRFDTETRCTYVDYNNKGQCPCTLCVVKMMCDQHCPFFDVFKKHIDDLKLEGLI